MEHNYKNGLCFGWIGNKLCSFKAIKELKSIEGNKYGIFCYKHAQLKTKELVALGIKLI